MIMKCFIVIVIEFELCSLLFVKTNVILTKKILYENKLYYDDAKAF